MASAAAVAAAVAAFTTTLCMRAALALAAPIMERLVFRGDNLFDDLFFATDNLRRGQLLDFSHEDQDQ